MANRIWRVLDRRRVFSGGPITDVAIETVELPNGRVVTDYYTITLPDYVLVFPEMADGSVCVLRQYRHGLRRVCLGFPGGALEPGESPLDAARRELLEELGCVADEWQALAALTTNGNQGCNRAHLFRATGCRPVALPRAPDMEHPEILSFRRDDLLAIPNLLEEIGLATHVALLLAAIDARFNTRRG